MKKIVVFCLLILFSSTICLDAQQTMDPNQAKYWHYRARLLKYFLAVGPGPGESLPASTRNQYDEQMSWGDTPVYLGYYIGVLVTEYKLLVQNNQPTDQTLTELYYAMNAITRLDIQADIEWQARCSCPAPAGINGFMLRDDVPIDFLSKRHRELNPVVQQVGWNGIDGQPGYENNDRVSSNWTGVHHLPPGPSDTQDPNTIENGFFTAGQDNLIELMMGLALVERSIGSFTPKPGIPLPITFKDLHQDPLGSISNSYDFYGQSQAMTRAFLNYMMDNPNNYPVWINDWTLRFPNLDEVGDGGGGDASRLSYGISREAQFITGEFNASYIANNSEFDYSLCAEPPARAFPQNVILAMTCAAVGDYWNGDVEGSIANQGNYPGGISWSTNEFGMDKFYGCLNRYLNSHSIADNPIINDCDVEDLLTSAPAEGPFCYSTSYIDGTGMANALFHAPPGWGSADRFYETPVDFAGQDGSHLSGNYNGLDYMLMHNLYYLAQTPIQTIYFSGSYPQFDPLQGPFGTIQAPYKPSFDRLWPDIVSQLTVTTTDFHQDGTYTGGVNLIGGLKGIDIQSLAVNSGGYFHASCQANSGCEPDPDKYIFGSLIYSPAPAGDHRMNPTGSTNTNSNNSHNTNEVTGYSASAEFKALAPEYNALQNFPNPVSSQTTFVFNLNEPETCSLEIYDLAGKQIKTLFQRRSLDKGEYSIPFDLSDIGDGIYFYTLYKGNQGLTRKMIKLKN